MNPALATIVMFAGNFAPQGWAICQGQTLSIAQNTALFSLLGTTYGGNGQTNFGLPDFRGRTFLGTGAGPGLSSVTLGEVGGQQSVTLTTNNLPFHSHTATLTVASKSGVPTNDEPAGAIPASENNIYSNIASPTDSLGGVSAVVSSAGSGASVSIRQPYLAVFYIIALQGIFPSRN